MSLSFEINFLIIAFDADSYTIFILGFRMEELDFYQFILHF